MMLMKRRGLAALLALVMGLTVFQGAALAEGTDLSALTPLVDLTTSAAMRVGETPETIVEGGVLSESFVYNFFLLGQAADASLGITADMLNDTALQADYLARSFSCGQPTLSGILTLGESYDYIGVRVMSADLSPDGGSVRLMGDVYQAAARLDTLTEDEYAQVRWLDKRAVIDLRKAENAPLGWLVASFSVDAELDMEEATQTYFSETMVEYINADQGFSLQYPAVFTENTLKEEGSGISAQLPDGSASFFARKMANTQGWTLEKILDARKQENPAVETNINEVSGCGRAVMQREDGHTVVDIYIVSDQWVYQAELTYDVSLAKDFSLYSDYMMNSFNADELGIG